MTKQNPRHLFRKLSSFDFPLAPSLTSRRHWQDVFRAKVKTGKGKQ
jgi:hypothetical protein